MDFDERYENYQKVYEAGLEIQRKDRRNTWGDKFLVFTTNFI